jgi:hypothetical protein
MKTPFSLAFATIAVYFAASATAATDVTWTGMPLTASSTSIRADGTLKYAYARGNYTANGVEFVGVGDKIINTANCVVWEASGGAGTSGATAPGDTESGGYKDILEHPWWASAKGRKIQLKNLEVGKKYLVQMIAFRDDYTTQTATAPDGVAVIHYGGTDWEYGGSLSAEFTADAATEEFTISYSGQALINGIQVRELSSAEPVSQCGLILICK